MRIFKVDLEYIYGGSSDNAEVNMKYELRLATRREAFAAANLDPTVWPDIGYVHGLIVNDRQFTELAIRGQKPEIKLEIPVPDEEPDDVTGTMAKFNRIAKKLLSLPGLTEPRSYNSRCEVHMPGQALATYNEVLLLESACSDELQTSLDRGWRMIAACPQPDQRRPDYILGRFNPNREGLALGGGAKRQP